MRIISDSNYIAKAEIQEVLIKRLKTKFSEHFENSIYPASIIDEILDESFIDSNPIFYLYYPHLFSKYFDFSDSDTLDLLSISGFLFYKSVIILDEVFDNKESVDHFQKFFIANICQEEALKILLSFFGRDSAFWQVWSKRKLEYIKAFKLDTSLSSIDSYADYVELADLKSTFGKIAIDCLYFLSDCKKTDIYHKLLESHKYFYTAFQIADDISDFEEDAINEQFNISAFELKNLLSKKNIAIQEYSLEQQKKLIYLEGVALELYSKAVKYLDKTNKSIAFLDSNKDLWSFEINKLHNTCLTHYLNIKGFLIEFQSLEKSESSSKAIGALDKAVSYLQNSLKEEGNWFDIFNDAGVSDLWTTAYVTFNLFQTNLIEDDFLEKSFEFIHKNRLKDGLWGYNKEWISDADSSSFALLSLRNTTFYKSKQHEISLKQWLNFQNKDGGFATYLDENTLKSSLNTTDIKDVSGWLQSHFCVSAVAYLVFIELGITEKEEFKQLRKYLINILSTPKGILSYWWTKRV